MHDGMCIEAEAARTDDVMTVRTRYAQHRQRRMRVCIYNAGIAASMHLTMRYRIAGLTVGASLLLAFFVQAATTSALLPTSDGTYLQWTPKSGTTHYTQVDESACNGTTDYVFTTTVGNRDSFGVSLSSVPDAAQITQIDLVPCASKNTSGGSNSTMNVFYRFDGVDSADSGAYSLTGTSPTGKATTTFSGLSAYKGSSSTLEIGAVYSAGNRGVRLGRLAAVVTYTTLVAPSSLTATVSTTSPTSSIVLTWTDGSSIETGFEIERRNVTASTSFALIATTTANVAGFTDTGLASSTTYQYRIRAFDPGGSSSYSNSASATTVPPPTAPTGLTSAVSATSSNSVIDLSWTDTSADETNFSVERRVGTGTFSQIATTTANDADYTNGGLVQNTTYVYRVRAYNASGYSAYSNHSTTTTLGPPTTPTGFSGTATSSFIFLWWNDVASEENFELQRRDTSTTTFAFLATTTADTLSYSDFTVSASTTYVYRLRAANQYGYSGYTTATTTTP